MTLFNYPTVYILKDYPTVYILKDYPTAYILKDYLHNFKFYMEGHARFTTVPLTALYDQNR